MEISWNFFHNRLRTAKPCFTRLVLVPRLHTLAPMRIGCVDVPIEIQAEPTETFISTPELLTEPDSNLQINLQIKVDLELTQ